MAILKGRTAIVVGASSGVGYGCALRFAEEGAKVVACARRLERLEKLATEAAANECKILPMTCDISKEEDLDRVVEKTIAEFGKVDILACIAQGGLEDHTFLRDATAKRAIESYMTGPVYTMLLMQKCFPYMKEQHYGRIITCASSAAVSGTPGYSTYAMAKGAIMALTRFSAKEVGKYGITVNCFLPVIRTEAFDLTPQAQEAAKMLTAMIPVGYFGKAYEDCSPILAFMASEDAKYLNGQFIGIDGGLTILA